MALDLTGITNENEFYSHHYLSALLEDDLKDVYKAWGSEADGDADEPWRALQRLARPFLVARDEFQREKKADVRLAIQRSFVRELLPVLGYSYKPEAVTDGSAAIPLLGRVDRASGAPLLWILEAFDADEDGADVLDLPIHECQIGSAPGEDDLTALINDEVFFREEPPRWALVVSLRHIALFDRSKWSERRALRFDLDDILSRRETSTLRATTALLHRDSTCPTDGLPLLDTLDEKSHEHAYSVSKDLKYALREAVELLGNEAVRYLREVRKEKVYERNLAGPLTEECLRYMYRLLFLFYIESRRELGYAPLNADAYVHGYSLQKLRDLEMVRLETDAARNGFFLHESIETLSRLIFDGFPEKGTSVQMSLEEPEHHTFRIPPLKSHLFDPGRTPILNGVKLRNEVLQRIIQLMSLTDPDSSRGGRVARGRISYAQLGINQLGAVYEALLSYRGFFAETDLYEVKKAGEKADMLDQAFFVPAEALEEYDEDEKVFERDGTLRLHPRGRFIYRLAGRDREKSASYYTPEVLTNCLVKYALKELLQDKTADEILELTVCEPAMGSAAFLNEAISQLADAYLQRKQTELGDALSPDEYATQKQRVKMYLADNNVYGVDLNPVAVELAEVSIWLNTLVPGGFVPWFGTQLKCGNSLVGARSQVFTPDALRTASGDASWLRSVPADSPVGAPRPAGTVYHFLVPDSGMASYDNKVIKDLMPSETAYMRAWGKTFCRAFAPTEIKRLQRLSDGVEQLWQRHTSELKRIDARTTDPFPVYGQPPVEEGRTPTTTGEKDRILQQELYSESVRNKSPYRRLKLVMDYWCALWFWPIDRADLLPTRDEFLGDIELLLVGKSEVPVHDTNEQGSLFPDTMPPQLALQLRDELGFVDIDALVRANPRLRVVQALGVRYRFHHWPLEFAALFAARGGFDLVLGNPPWIKLSWSESGVMGDAEPRFVIKSFSAQRMAALRNEVLKSAELRAAYFGNYEEADATTTFLNANQNYPLLRGSQTNLYKCFLPVAWAISRQCGVSSFLHPEGVYDDPKGGQLRTVIYRRLRGHFQFWNETSLFPEVHNQTSFSINVYGPDREPGFATISNLYTPPAVDACFDDDGSGPVPGIKNDDGKWDLTGHRDRIVRVGLSELRLFASLYDDATTPALEARLPAVHSTQIVEVLRRFAAAPRRLGDLEGEHFSTVMFDETYAQRDGTIKRETRLAGSADEWIFSGPHFFVGNPFYKTPRAVCDSNKAYDNLDLITLPENYLPRTNYVPACSPEEYRARTPRVPWGDRKRVTEFYRVVNRRMFGSSSERSLIASIAPPGCGHINTVVSTAFSGNGLLLDMVGGCLSLPFDLYLKSTGRSDLYDLTDFPVLRDKNVALRALRLICISRSFAALWHDQFSDSFRADSWTAADQRQSDSCPFDCLGPDWTVSTPVRTDFERRQAQLEIDVLVGRLLGLSLSDLSTAYRVQFPVLCQYEQDTWYDRNGRIVFTPSKGLTGAGLPRKRKANDDARYGIVSPERTVSGILLGWEDIREMKEGIVTKTFMDDTLPGGPIERTIEYHAPFDRCDREEDYAVAWAHFEKRFAEAAS